MPGAGARVGLPLQLLVHRGPGSTTALRVQGAATSPHTPAPLPGAAPFRCWDGKFLSIQRGWGSSDLWGSKAGQQDRQKQWRAFLDAPLLNILQETLVPCLVSPGWDEEADPSLAGISHPRAATAALPLQHLSITAGSSCCCH